MLRKAMIRFILSLFMVVVASLCLAKEPASSNPVQSRTDTKDAGRKTGGKMIPDQSESRTIPLLLSPTKAEKLELVMDSPTQKVFTLNLKNPLDAEKRKIKFRPRITFQRDSDMLNASVQPIEEVTLRPGEEMKLKISFEKSPQGGYIPKSVFEGALVIEKSTDLLFAGNSQELPDIQPADTDMKSSAQVFNITIRNPFLLPGGIEEVFILVLIGSLASLLLNKSLPISARKAKNRQRIAELEEQAQPLTVFEKDLRDKLAIDLIRAKALNDNTKFLTPSALDRLSSVDTILDKIGKDILIRQEISQCYIDLDAEDGISYSDKKKIRDILKKADTYLCNDGRDKAEIKLKEAIAYLHLKRENRSLKTHDEAFQRKVHELTDKHKNFTEPAFILHLLKEANLILKETASQASTKELDLIYRKLQLFDSFHQHLKYDEDPEKGKYSKNYDRFLAYLHSNRYEDLENAINLFDSISQYGIDESDFETECRKKGAFHILSYPPDPQIDKPVRFEMKFSRDDFNQSPLRNHYRCIWYFGDQTRETEGFRVVHCFQRRGGFILTRKWCRRNWLVLRAGLEKRKKLKNIFREYDLTVDIFSAISPIHLHTQKCIVLESLEKDYSSGITLQDVFSYGITLLISCAIAVSTADIADNFKTLKDILMPFLLGFGLDISKEKIMTATKGIKGAGEADGKTPQKAVK